MDDNTYTFELIERYLSNDLSPEELSSFNKRLESDKSFAQDVENQRLTHKASDIYSQLKTKEKVRESLNKVLESEKSKRRRLLSIAATIAILIITGFGFIVSTNYSNQSLADANFDLYPDRITTMGNATDEQLAAGMKAYNEKEFEKVIELFSELPATLPESDFIKLYTAIAFMEINQIDSAKNIFQQLIDSKSTQADVAQWYLALAYLKSSDSENAKLLLQQIVIQKGFQSKKAAKILKKLESPLRNLPWIH